MNRRATIRNKREQDQRRQRTILLIIVVAGALLITLVLISPSLNRLIERNKPLGDIIDAQVIQRAQINENHIGDPNAPVKVDEYADFQCPACAQWSQAMEQEFLTKYVSTGKVYLTFNAYSFIDDRGPGRESKAAAEAAYCAMDQGKFWEYHDLLYANQTGENVGDFSDRRLIGFAEKLGLDKAAFTKCFDSSKHTQRVTDERKLGESKGVNSTPSFLVDGKLVNLVRYDDLDKAIDTALQGK